MSNYAESLRQVNADREKHKEAVQALYERMLRNELPGELDPLLLEMAVCVSDRGTGSSATMKNIEMFRRMADPRGETAFMQYCIKRISNYNLGIFGTCSDTAIITAYRQQGFNMRMVELVPEMIEKLATYSVTVPHTIFDRLQDKMAMFTVISENAKYIADTLAEGDEFAGTTPEREEARKNLVWLNELAIFIHNYGMTMQKSESVDNAKVIRDAVSRMGAVRAYKADGYFGMEFSRGEGELMQQKYIVREFDAAPLAGNMQEQLAQLEKISEALKTIEPWYLSESGDYLDMCAHLEPVLTAHREGTSRAIADSYQRLRSTVKKYVESGAIGDERYSAGAIRAVDISEPVRFKIVKSLAYLIERKHLEEDLGLPEPYAPDEPFSPEGLEMMRMIYERQGQ